MLAVASIEAAGVSRTIELDEDFERVLGICIPLEQPSSALAAQAHYTLRRADGGRVYVNPSTVVAVEELLEEGDG